jgi:molybdenum cofactor cytidylyltransferase
VEAAIASASDAAVRLMPRVHAPDADAGLSASLRTGLAALPQDWGAVLVMLGDMPFVRPETLAMLAARLAGGAGAVVPVHRDRRGNPAGFARRHWPRLMALSGDRGASALLDPLRAVEVPVSDPGILLDLDRPEDLARFSAAPSP